LYFARQNFSIKTRSSALKTNNQINPKSALKKTTSIIKLPKNKKALPNDPKTVLVLGLNVGDIEPPRTGTTLAYRSVIVSPMTPTVKYFFVKFHNKLPLPILSLRALLVKQTAKIRNKQKKNQEIFYQHRYPIIKKQINSENFEK
jgi:hypothetical protein